MRYFLLVLPAAIALWALQSCKTQRLTLKDYNGPKLFFGSGGGFAGTFKEYILLPNGQVFFSENGGSVRELKAVKKRQAKPFFKSADRLNLLNIVYNKPGNMYYYIRYRTKDGDNKLSWGREKTLIHPELDSLFRSFMDIAPNPSAAVK